MALKGAAIKTNGNSQEAVRTAALHVRVDAVERDVGHIENQVNAIRDAMATKADITFIASEIKVLAQQQLLSAKPNYVLLVSIMALGVSILVALGALAYVPINTATADLKLAVISLADKAVYQRQYESDVILARQDRHNIRAEATELFKTTIQQQRYNSDKTSRDDEIKILRERFDKMLTRDEFSAQHGDLKIFIQALIAQQDRQLSETLRRIDRLEEIQIKIR